MRHPLETCVSRGDFKCGALAACQGRAKRVLLRKMAKPPFDRLTHKDTDTSSSSPPVNWRCSRRVIVFPPHGQSPVLEQQSECVTTNKDLAVDQGRAADGDAPPAGWKVRKPIRFLLSVCETKTNTAPPDVSRAHLHIMCQRAPVTHVRITLARTCAHPRETPLPHF